jgi:2-dehydropantoate 2-reductase
MAPMKKIVVVGLGAVGGLIAARLARAGHGVHALARGATLAAVRTEGLALTEGGRTQRWPIEASDDAAAIGAADLLVIALKAPALARVAHSLAPLLGPHTVVLPAMNGVPWWFLRSAPCHDSEPLTAVDPEGAIAATLPAERTLGCVVHLSCSTPAAGHVQHGFGQRLIVGEPAGGPSARCDAVATLLESGGFTVERSADVRRDIWYKLWGNMTMNPVSALTGSTGDTLLDDELLRAFMARAMGEAAAIGSRIGCPIEQSAEARMALTRELGAFKTSMLQDAESGRPLELDALVGAVREIGTRVGVPTPEIDTLFALTRRMARQRGLYA